MTKERFYITEEEPGFGDVYYEVIRDRETDKIVCEDIYDTLKLLNELTTIKPLHGLDAASLIQIKETIHDKLESKYFDLLHNERELKNVENNLWLKTDFKEQGLTNDSLRRAFVSDNTHDLRFKVDMAKYELRQLEHHIIIIDDLLRLRLQEVKPE